VRRPFGEAEAAKKLDEVSQILRESIGQIREVLLDLSSPSMNEIGLGVAISEWLEQQIGNPTGARRIVDGAPVGRGSGPVCVPTVSSDGRVLRRIGFRILSKLAASTSKIDVINRRT
jgi:hypothetical protein